MQIRMRITVHKAPWIRIHLQMPIHMQMPINMQMPVQEGPRMRIHMRIPVSRYLWMPTRMQIFMTFLNNASHCQIGAAFVTEYRLLHYTKY